MWCRSGGVQCSCGGRPSPGGRRAAGPAAGLRTGRWLSGPGLRRLAPRSARLAGPTAEHRYGIGPRSSLAPDATPCRHGTLDSFFSCSYPFSQVFALCGLVNNNPLPDAWECVRMPLRESFSFPFFAVHAGLNDFFMLISIFSCFIRSTF